MLWRSDRWSSRIENFMGPGGGSGHQPGAAQLACAVSRKPSTQNLQWKNTISPWASTSTGSSEFLSDKRIVQARVPGFLIHISTSNAPRGRSVNSPPSVTNFPRERTQSHEMWGCSLERRFVVDGSGSFHSRRPATGVSQGLLRKIESELDESFYCIGLYERSSPVGGAVARIWMKDALPSIIAVLFRQGPHLLTGICWPTLGV